LAGREAFGLVGGRRETYRVIGRHRQVSLRVSRNLEEQQGHRRNESRDGHALGREGIGVLGNRIYVELRPRHTSARTLDDRRGRFTPIQRYDNTVRFALRRIAGRADGWSGSLGIRRSVALLDHVRHLVGQQQATARVSGYSSRIETVGSRL
jgi:hypothetical protein